MGISLRVLAAGMGLLLALAGCTGGSTARPVTAAPAPVPRAVTMAGLEALVGRTASVLTGLFGKADLDVREGSARKLQFAGPACILDAYLYPPSGGGEPIVTHVDARLPDGRDMDRASCVAALQAGQR